MRQTKVLRNFTLSSSLDGLGVLIILKDQGLMYDHDEVLNANRNHYQSLKCWSTYGSYTKSLGVPENCMKFIKRF